MPLAAVAVHELGRHGLLPRPAPLVHLLRLAAVFAALPAALSAGGVGRVAARDPLRLPPVGRLGSALRCAARFAPAGAGMVLLTAVAARSAPGQPAGWIWLAGGGAAAGLATGALIGLAAGGRMR